MEQGTRSEKCASQREWPFCTTDEWGPKCPSGCRIEGLMNKYDHSLLKRIEKIRSLLDQNTAKQRSADLATKQTYDYLKDKLTTDAGHNTNYYDLAQNLRQRITDMKIKIDRQLRILAALKDRVKDQVVEMQRLEVDIDIKLRSCKGSCQGYSEFQVDHESYVELDKQINQLDSQSAQSRAESVKTLYVMKSRPLQDQIVDSIYKSKDTTGSVAAQRREDVFNDVPMVQLVLGEEGSSSSPATISKVQGTSYSSPTFSSSSSSSSSSFSSPSITEHGGSGVLFGTGGGLPGHSSSGTTHMSTQTISCTKSTRRTVVHTKDGPVEKVEEVYEGGPECQALADSTKGGMSSFFPTLSHSGGAKGSILGDAKTGFGDPFAVDGIDLGGFMTDNAEEDVPDFHARSVKTRRVERQADYIGKGTETSDVE